MQNRSRYDTLNISIQTDSLPRKRPISELSRTIDVANIDIREKESPKLPLKIAQDQEQTIDERAKDKYFQQLYRKNEQLRRELKSISVKLTEQIEKVKFNPLRRSSAGAIVQNKADKGIKRQLENAHRQAAMYRKQIQTLKAREETEASFDKLKDLQNLISYRDTEISQMQSQLKSVKAVKHMQQKKLEVDVKNEQIQNIMTSYAQELKDLKNKLKEYTARDRKRQENYKKQQAYQIEIEKRLREANEMYHPNIKKEEPPRPAPQGKQISDEEWRIIKAEVEYQKSCYKQLHKKIQAMAKLIKKQRTDKESIIKQLQEKESKIQSIKVKIHELKKLVKSSREIVDDVSDSDKEHELSPKPNNPSSVLSDNQDATFKSTVSKKQPKEWNGQQHLDQKGFAAKQDIPFNDKQLCDGKDSRIVGISIHMDDDNQISTIQATYSIQDESIDGQKSSIFEGTRLQWVLQNNDYVKSISGAFSTKGNLEYLIMVSKYGKTGRFGNTTSTQKPFTLDISDGQVPKYLYGATHKFGKDVRISMLGACIGPENLI